MAFYMLAIMNGSSLFGRVIPGILADRYGAFNVMILSAGTSGVVCMCWTKAQSIAGIGVWAAVYGFTSGASSFAMRMKGWKELIGSRILLGCKVLVLLHY